MKYYQTSKFPKFVGSAGFYTIIALCLLAIGAASWFAVSRYNEAQSQTGDTSSPKSYSSYDGPSSSYNSSTVIPNADVPQNNASVANPVSDVPYSSVEQTSEPEKRSFVLPAEGNVSKGYSDTALQYSQTYGDMRLHTGIDIQCDKGSDVKSAGKGTVTAVEESGELGRFISIDHGDGITVKYCGFESVNVKTGDKVSAGTVLGTVGSVPCECADKSHIHIEALKNGETVSPLSALGLE